MTDLRSSRGELTKLAERAEAEAPKLRFLAYRSGARQSADQDDAVQDAWVTILRKPPVGNPRAYLWGCVKMSARKEMWRRTHGARAMAKEPLMVTKRDPYGEGYEEPQPGAITAEPSLLWIEVKRIVDQGLTEREKTVLGYSMLGYTYEEIGKMFGVTRQAVSLWLAYIRSVIKEAMNED